MTVYLEIATAIVVTFFTLSLVVTAVAEVLALALNQRGKLLRATLRDLAGNQDLLDQLLKTKALRPILQARSGSDRPSNWRFPDALPALAVADAFLDLTGKTPKEGTLGAFLERAATETRETLADAYADVITQLSLRYKGRQQIVSIVVGTLLAAAMNLNVLAMASALQTDEARRTAIAEYAEGVVAQGLPDRETDGGSEATPEDIKDATDALTQSLKGLQGFTEVAGLGWQAESYMSDDTLDCAALALGVLSWLIAGLASVLGAPFWFDLLTRTNRALKVARTVPSQAAPRPTDATAIAANAQDAPK